MPDFTINNEELNDLTAALASLGRRDFTDPKPRYALNKLRRQSRVSVDALTDTVQSITDQFGRKDEAGHLVAAANGQGVELADGVGYRAAMKVLMAETTVIAGVRQLTMKELGAIPGNADELVGLGPFLEDKEPE